MAALVTSDCTDRVLIEEVKVTLPFHIVVHEVFQDLVVMLSL